MSGDVRPITATVRTGFIPFAGGDYVVGIDPQEEFDALARWPQFGREWFSDAQLRSVRLAPFAIARHAVTAAEFAETLTRAAAAAERVESLYWLDSPYTSIERRADGRYAALSGHEDLPVAGVTLAGARRHAADHGARLPIETEWEIAARGHIASVPGWTGLDRSLDYVNGFDTRNEAIRAFRTAWLDGRGPVAERLLPSGDGMPIGMIGNLWEWCEAEPGSGDGALRGGSWNEIVPLVFHPSFRHRIPSGYRLVMHFGLRLAASIEEETA